MTSTILRFNIIQLKNMHIEYIEVVGHLEKFWSRNFKLGIFFLGCTQGLHQGDWGTEQD